MWACEDVITTFIRTHTGAVRRYAYALTGDVWLADDIAQETFIRAWRHWPSCRDPAARVPWVMAICRHVAFDALKARSRASGRLAAGASVLGTPECHDAGLAWVDITGLMHSLTLEHREVLVLVDVLGYDYRTASIILDCPVGTVRSRLSRARGACRALVSSLEREARGA